MANITINQLPSLTSVNSTSVIPLEQGGVTYSSTVQDIVAGGKPLGELEIVADGSLGGPAPVTYYISTLIPSNTNGTTYATLVTSPYINLDTNQLAGQFTATNVSFPSITFADSIQIRNTSTLQVLSAPLLEIFTNNLNVTNNSQLITLNFPLLKIANYINFGNTPNLTTLNFPLLESARLVIESSNPGITGFRQSMFPALRTGGFDFGYNTLPSFEINFPLVTKVTALSGNAYSANVTNINLPSVIDVTTTYISANSASNLTNVIIGAVGVTKSWGQVGSSTFVYFNGNALNQTSVDNILTVLASLDGTNGTTISNNGTLSLSGGSNAAPSAAGVTARNTLAGRGWSVSTN